MASSSRERSNSPFSHRKPSTPYLSTSSSSLFMSRRLMPCLCSSTASSFFNSSGGHSGRSMTPSHSHGESMYHGPPDYNSRSPVEFKSKELIANTVDAPQTRDSISMTIWFRPLSAFDCNEREYQRGDKITWYAEGDKIVKNEYNLINAYAFDKVFGPQPTSDEVYEVTAKPAVKLQWKASMALYEPRPGAHSSVLVLLFSNTGRA